MDAAHIKKLVDARISRARYRVVTVERGDGLFIPAGHWHFVSSRGVHVADPGDRRVHAE